MGLILAPNERWNSILHMRVERKLVSFSGARVSNLIVLAKKIGKHQPKVCGQCHSKINSFLNKLSAD